MCVCVWRQYACVFVFCVCVLKSHCKYVAPTASVWKHLFSIYFVSLIFSSVPFILAVTCRYAPVLRVVKLLIQLFVVVCLFYSNDYCGGDGCSSPVGPEWLLLH